MRKIKFINHMVLCVAAIVTTSCGDLLDLAPIDNYGSGNFWKTEAQVSAYVDGLHDALRAKAGQHVITFGELRGGHYKDGVSADGLTISNGAIILQNLSRETPGVSKFGDIYGCITNINLFIAHVTDAAFMPENKKNYYLGQAYGLRAFYYFDLYRVYGGVPIRLGVEVVEGELDPLKLSLGRAKPSEVMAQIKKDLDTSLQYFGEQSGFDPYGHGNKVYWSKAATECLAGEVYLWNSKVTIGDNKADISDLSKAKHFLKNVEGNYGLQLQQDFKRIFSTDNEGNSEVILAVSYMEGEAENSLPRAYTYSLVSGTTNKDSYRVDGSVWNDALDIQNNGQQQYEYKFALYEKFEDSDSRREATFMPSYRKKESRELYIYGTHVCKNLGSLNAQGNRVYDGDFILYRLSWVYLALAEIANMESDNVNVERYINFVRNRAYKSETGSHIYKASDFLTNELAILHEKDKEFVQEGQRWWDLCRMKNAKDGIPLVFCNEGDIEGKRAVLNQETEAYKVLWPLDNEILNNDSALEQTPGYEKQEE